ncbi:MAG: hypothetical protein JWM68_5782 [Verrucomicrobiales bacterium]|nr:hypothetical protein [Verrucomicrobiales bacterium]
MKIHFRSHFWTGAKTIVAALAIAGFSLEAAAPSVTTVVVSGTKFYNGTMSNIVLENGTLHLGSDTSPTTFNSGYSLFGIYTSGELTARNPFQSLSFNYDGVLLPGSDLVCAVRTQAGGEWSIWTELTASQLGKPIAVNGSATALQYRISFFANSQATSPLIRSVTARLSSSGAPASQPRQTANATHPTYHIYATREGLVGNRTANGHTIVSRDHFVALPSGTVLDCNGCSTYTVTLKNPANGNTVTEKIYDVGPWNTKDNYWHTPRAEFSSLALGLPEAQAAYQNGFNGGHDEFGRTVANPAGIDLADGTFWDSMGMVGNGWIDVTFNMENLPSAVVIVDNSDPGFTASANWATGTSSTDKNGANYRYRSTASVSDAANWNANIAATKTTTAYCWYPQGANRSSTAPYIVYHQGSSSSVSINQQISGGQWVSLGAYTMNAGGNDVKLSCWTTTGFIVVADAIKWAQ